VASFLQIPGLNCYMVLPITVVTSENRLTLRAPNEFVTEKTLCHSTHNISSVNKSAFPGPAHLRKVNEAAGANLLSILFKVTQKLSQCNLIRLWKNVIYFAVKFQIS
jgi:hypothetical protein